MYMYIYIPTYGNQGNWNWDVSTIVHFNVHQDVRVCKAEETSTPEAIKELFDKCKQSGNLIIYMNIKRVCLSRTFNNLK